MRELPQGVTHRDAREQAAEAAELVQGALVTWISELPAERGRQVWNGLVERHGRVDDDGSVRWLPDWLRRVGREVKRARGDGT